MTLTAAERGALQARVVTLHGMVGTLYTQTIELKHRLQPIWEKKRNLRERIQATHGPPPNFNPRRAPDRVPLFEALLQISVDHGFTETAYGDLNRRMKAYEREAASIEKVLDKDGRKKGHGAVSTRED